MKEHTAFKKLPLFKAIKKPNGGYYIEIDGKKYYTKLSYIFKYKIWN